MHERRKAARSRTFFGGVIQFRQCKAPVNCTVRNYSLAGAKVTLSETDLIPDRFDLTIAKKERAYRTRMIWRNINEAGVEFLPEQGEPVTIPLEWARRLRQCEAEKSRLRKRIARLTERTCV